jgi:hypothetical protein
LGVALAPELLELGYLVAELKQASHQPGVGGKQPHVGEVRAVNRLLHAGGHRVGRRRREQHVEKLGHDLVSDLFLVREVDVEKRVGDIRALVDVGHAQVAVAAVLEEPRGGRLEPRPRALTLALERPRRGGLEALRERQRIGSRSGGLGALAALGALVHGFHAFHTGASCGKDAECAAAT